MEYDTWVVENLDVTRESSPQSFSAHMHSREVILELRYTLIHKESYLISLNENELQSLSVFLISDTKCIK